MPREDRATWKSSYFMKIIVSMKLSILTNSILLLQQLLDDFPKCFIVGADNVGSKQMQAIRMSLRGKAVVLMGKNTMMRKAIRGHLENNPALEKLLPHIKGNVGFVFTKEDLCEVRDMLLANKVPAAARAGAIAPCDVTVPAQNTGLGPEKTSFFQALGITTKISRGTIEILGVRNIASVCLEIGYPTLASVPHSVINGYKRVLAVAVETDYSFPLADKVKAYLADPSAFAAVAAPAAAAETAAAPAAAKEEVKEESEESDDDMGFGLFD
uniref:Large ribosomal subunit protein uL10 n=1 Tax=Sphaeramia orbicularis TaxID=375764 RepID=A0A672Y926_9TELE